MSFDDDWLKNGLPTYHGGKDGALARKMIDRLGGPDGFKTDYRVDAEGVVTRVHLKGDMAPQISTTSSSTAPITCSVYAEAGIVDLHGPSPTLPEGTLYRTDYVQAQLGAATPVVGAGTLKPPGITGTPS